MIDYLNTLPILSLLFLIISIFALSPRPQAIGGVPQSFIFGLVFFVTLHVGYGLVASVLGFSVTKFPHILVPPIFTTLVVIYRGTRFKLGRTQILFNTPKSDRILNNPSWIIPFVYLLSFLRFTIEIPSIGFARFVNHWDVASNIFLFVESINQGSLSMNELVYPRAPHFAGASASSMFAPESEASTIFSIFIAYEWFWFCVLMLAIGVTANFLSHLLRFERSIQCFVVFASQAVLIIPSVKKNLFDFHSLSLLVTLALVLTQVLIFLNFHTVEGNPSRRVLYLVLSLSVLFLSGFSYPLLVPLQVFPILLILFKSKDVWKFLTRSGQLKWLLIVPSAILLFFAGFGLTYLDNAWQQLASRQTFSTVGAVETASLTWLVLLSIFSFIGILLLFAVEKKSLKAPSLFGYWLGMLLTVIVPWLIVGNFNRQYGENYYPKKMEWAALPLLCSLAVASFAWFLNKTIGRQKVSFFFILLPLAMLLLSVFDNSDPRININEQRASSLRFALTEAEIPGTSLINSEVELDAVHASMLSNTLDFSYLNDSDVDGPPTLPEIVDGARKLFKGFSTSDICHMVWRGFNQVLVSLDGSRIRCSSK